MPGLGRFLLGRFFYSDAVNTIIVVMTVVDDRGEGPDRDRRQPDRAARLTVVAVARELRLGPRSSTGSGPKRTLMIVLGIVGGRAGPRRDLARRRRHRSGSSLFLIAGAILGSGLGGVQVADRVFMVRLSPPERLGEFFGLYGLVGKGSQVIGQLLYGATLFLLLDTLKVGAYQLAVLTLLVTMVIGYRLIRPGRRPLGRTARSRS